MNMFVPTLFSPVKNKKRTKHDFRIQNVSTEKLNSLHFVFYIEFMQERILPDKPPEKAPVLFNPKAYMGRASDFLIIYYGPYLEAGVLFRPWLRKLDPKLASCLASEFYGRTGELQKLLPKASDALTKRVEAEAGCSVTPEERKRIAGKLRVRACRQRKIALGMPS